MIAGLIFMGLVFAFGLFVALEMLFGFGKGDDQ